MRGDVTERVSMDTIPVAPTRTTWADARYPYLVIRMMSAVYSVRPLPSDLSRDLLVALAWSAMNGFEGRFRMCLVLGPEEALYLEPGGTSQLLADPPSGGLNLELDPGRTDYLPS